MSSLNVGGAGSATWPDREWGAASRKDKVEQVDSIKKVVDDQRSLGPLANGTARRTSQTTALTQQDFEVATRLGPHGVTMKSFDQLVPNAPKVERNPWNPVADRKSVNGYDHIMESLRTSALKRDAALAGSAKTEAAPTATADTAAVQEQPETVKLAYKPLTASEFGEQYVRNAIAQYQRNSSLTPVQPTPAQEDPAVEPTPEDPAVDPTPDDPTVEPEPTTEDPTVEPEPTTEDPTVEPEPTTEDPTVEPEPTTDDPTVEPEPTTEDPTVSPDPEPTPEPDPTLSDGGGPLDDLIGFHW